MTTAAELRAQATFRPRGRTYEEFEVGERIVHHWGRTLCEADTLQFSTLTLSYNPLYFNREYARAHGHPDLVVNPQLVFNVVLGLSVEDNSEGLAGPFLGVFELHYHEPVYPGDTITATSTVTHKRLSEKQPDKQGIVGWHTQGFNQHGRCVVEFKRSNLSNFAVRPLDAGKAAMTEIARLTGSDTYFEDFAVGQTIRHARGKTITNLENVGITNMVMNTAAGHFDEVVAGRMFGEIIVYGGVNFSVVLGLASQDTIENALAELGLDKIRLTARVTHGDTLYAYSRVIEKRDADRDDAGIVVFQHWGVNQRDEMIAEVQRTALIKRKSHWGAA